MSLFVFAVLAAATVAVAGGAAVATRWSRKRGAVGPEAQDKASPFDQLELQVGDVVMLEGKELWLTGALVLSENTDCRVGIFLGSSSLHKARQAVLVRLGPPRKLAWTQQEPVEPWLVPPDSLELRGELYARVNRLPLSIVSCGEGWEGATEKGLLLQYDSPSGAVAFALVCESNCVLWSGTWIPEGALLKLGGGRATLREEGT